MFKSKSYTIELWDAIISVPKSLLHICKQWYSVARFRKKKKMEFTYSQVIEGEN